MKSYGAQIEVKLEDPDGVMRKYKQTGDIALRNQLVLHYIQHVNIAIYSMRSILLSNIPFEDFFNQGVLALMDCLERYDPDRGATFDTYSYTGIRGAILKYLRKQNWLPNRLWEARKNIAHNRTVLEQKLMREPTDAELAESLGFTQTQLINYTAQISVIDTVSFEDLLSKTYESAVEHEPSVDDGGLGQELFRSELCTALAEAIDALPPKQKQVIALHYYENLNLREIGDLLDLSSQRVSQLKKKALSQLAGMLKNYDLYL